LLNIKEKARKIRDNRTEKALDKKTPGSVCFPGVFYNTRETSVMKKGRWKWIVVVVLLVIIAAVLYRLSTQELPMQEIEKARLAISDAEKNQARIYARDTFNKARQYYELAMVRWQEENDKWFLTRDYTETKELAEKAQLSAFQAGNKAGKSSINLKFILADRIKFIQKKLGLFDSVYSKMPLKNQHFQEMGKAGMLFDEGLLAFKKSEYTLAEQKMDSAEMLIDMVNIHAQRLLKKYFEHYPQWQEWVKDNIAWSAKNNCHTIIVDKFYRKLYLYNKGRIKTTYNVELGPNWIGDKMFQGDQATPEGEYTVVKKKGINNTKYHKALLLDYPNEDDRIRFLKNKKSGTIKQNKQIGNLIEIHGNGGKGSDWTNGCIALTNEDMDHLFDIVPNNTRVTIVGSFTSFDEIINAE
jgi:hypothetical protein